MRLEWSCFVHCWLPAVNQGDGPVRPQRLWEVARPRGHAKVIVRQENRTAVQIQKVTQLLRAIRPIIPERAVKDFIKNSRRKSAGTAHNTSRRWRQADFEALVRRLPHLSPSNAASSELVVVDAMVGPDLAVAFTCPALLRCSVAHKILFDVGAVCSSLFGSRAVGSKVSCGTDSQTRPI